MSKLSEIPIADRVGYDPLTKTYHVPFDWSHPDSVSLAVIESVAAVIGVEPQSMQVLCDVLNPDALNALFRPVSDESDRDSGNVTFTLDGVAVTVYAYGEIVVDVTKPTQSTESEEGEPGR